MILLIILATCGIAIVACVLMYKSIRIIPNNKCAVVEKWRSNRGSVKGGIIALKEEAGYQPEVLRGGIHVKPPWVYKIHKVPLVTIPQGQIGYVFARDGHPLKPNQTLGRTIPECKGFQDVVGFLRNGGQRGPQRGIIREGTYAINLSQFVVILKDRIYHWEIGEGDYETFVKMAKLISDRDGFKPVVIKGKNDQIGIVTTHGGPPLASGEIIAPEVGDENKLNHNNFQNPEVFLAAGGKRGKQHQVLVDGTHFINRLFATVQLIPKTVVPVGYVGVVVSYIGTHGLDSTGKLYKHGELVEQGCKGVWKDALLPGKYAFNTYAGKVIQVPTTNIVLKWISDTTGGHKLDENLCAVDLITKDAFEPSLPLSVVIHIDYRKAPRVIQRFGDVKRLVEQTLDPMVAAYFKNIGQTKTVIQLIQERNDIQRMASDDMKTKFLHYDLELEEVLIGTPTSSEIDGRIEQILVQLRERQIAREQVETYEQQEKAAMKERELNEARSRAKQQTVLTESEISINIQSNEGRAEYERSVQEANRIKVLAMANAEKQAKIGIAKAMAIEEQVNAYGGPNYQVLQVVMDRFSQAVEKSGVEIVPRMVVNAGGGGGRPYSAFESLILVLLAEHLGVEMNDEEDGPRREKIDAIRQSIVDAMNTEHSEQSEQPQAAEAA